MYVFIFYTIRFFWTKSCIFPNDSPDFMTTTRTYATICTALD